MATKLNRSDRAYQFMLLDWLHRACIGQLRASVRLVRELHEAAQSLKSRRLRFAAHWAGAVTYHHVGQFEESIRQSQCNIQEYDEQTDRHFLDTQGYDAKTVALLYSGLALSVLGRSKAAVDRVREGLVDAARKGHMVNQCYAMYIHAWVSAFLGDASSLKRLDAEMTEIAQAQSLWFFSHVIHPLLRAWCLLLEGRFADARIAFGQAIPNWMGAGLGIAFPHYAAMHAECCARSGQLEEAEQIVKQALEMVHRPGWEETFSLSEVIRVQGLIAELKNDLSVAESYYRSARTVAIEQSAKAFELRACIDLARLSLDRGDRPGGVAILAPVIEYFQDGYDTADLIEARALLDRLG